MDRRFLCTDRLRFALKLAGDEARRHGFNQIRPEDLLHGLMVDCSGISHNVLRDAHVGMQSLPPNIPHDEWVGLGEQALGRLSNETEQLLERAHHESEIIQKSNNYPPFVAIGDAHVFLAIAADPERPVAKLLASELAKVHFNLDDLRRRILAVFADP